MWPDPYWEPGTWELDSVRVREILATAWVEMFDYTLKEHRIPGRGTVYGT
jgi:hypothetical protein